MKSVIAPWQGNGCPEKWASATGGRHVQLSMIEGAMCQMIYNATH